MYVLCPPERGTRYMNGVFTLTKKVERKIFVRILYVLEKETHTKPP